MMNLPLVIEASQRDDIQQGFKVRVEPKRRNGMLVSRAVA